ncbi:MAG TPA: hypothetical protein VNI20_11195, partial [Fimbriimonadaceae bacterium]|nr:hypothetical protein [Fimbriimonadaceae bacterium]
DVYPAPVSRSPILLRPSRIAKILGMPVEVGAASQYLTALGFEVSQKDDGLVCAPPTWRIDVVREDDLVEEVGRIHGYEKIPELLPQGETTRGGVFGADAMIDEVRDELLRCGLTQTVSHTLRDLHPLDALGDRTRVRTPHSPEIAHLRNSNLPSLADAANRNGNNDLHLFEIGKVFPETGERASAAILEVGGDRFEDWQKRQSPGSDFFSLKGILERVFARVSAPFGVGASEDERLHPTRQASLESRSAFIGVVGQIHPEKAEACGLPKETVLAEIDLGALWDACGAERHLREISRNPATRRDIAIVLDRSVPYSDVSAAIESAGGEVLERHWLFDVYCGKGIPDGSHSLAIALQLRKVGSNFTDEEANQVRDSVVQALEGLGATLR